MSDMSWNEAIQAMNTKNALDEQYPEVEVSLEDVFLARRIMCGLNSPFNTAVEHGNWELAMQDAARLIANYRKAM